MSIYDILRSVENAPTNIFTNIFTNHITSNVIFLIKEAQ